MDIAEIKSKTARGAAWLLEVRQPLGEARALGDGLAVLKREKRGHRDACSRQPAAIFKPYCFFQCTASDRSSCLGAWTCQPKTLHASTLIKHPTLFPCGLALLPKPGDPAYLGSTRLRQFEISLVASLRFAPIASSSTRVYPAFSSTGRKEDASSQAHLVHLSAGTPQACKGRPTVRTFSRWGARASSRERAQGSLTALSLEKSAPTKLASVKRHLLAWALAVASRAARSSKVAHFMLAWRQLLGFRVARMEECETPAFEQPAPRALPSQSRGANSKTGAGGALSKGLPEKQGPRPLRLPTPLESHLLVGQLCGLGVSYLAPGCCVKYPALLGSVVEIISPFVPVQSSSLLSHRVDTEPGRR
jgi:hypothetical protein